MLKKQPFTLGRRPASADLAIYAQLTQLAKFDPTPAAICLAQAPRTYAWVDIVDDMSGQPAKADEWLAPENAREHLFDLLTEIGRTYTPALIANASAIVNGENQMETIIDGKQWEQPAFPYQAKCLQWIREAFATLSPTEQATVLEIIEGTGCEPLVS
jgi:hypothetical protein